MDWIIGAKVRACRCRRYGFAARRRGAQRAASGSGLLLTPMPNGAPALVHTFGISQPRASNLLNRHIEEFNSETHIAMLARVGVRVEVRPVSRDRYRRFDVPPRSRAGV